MVQNVQKYIIFIFKNFVEHTYRERIAELQDQNERKDLRINLLEQNLEAITQTLARLQKEGCNDEKILNELREERDKILKDLKL